MAKLYFKYGAMGSSKSAQALITQFNYEELGMSVWLIKPSIDTRDGADIVQSRIGLKRGSPGMSTVFAISSFFADMCGVGIGILFPPQIINLALLRLYRLCAA